LALPPLVRIEKLAKIYRSGDKDLVIFRDLELEVSVGEQIAIIGESGAGKSTFLHLIGGLDKPTEGAIFYKGTNITGFPNPDSRPSVIAKSATSGSSIIFCPNSPPRKMLACRYEFEASLA